MGRRRAAQRRRQRRLRSAGRGYTPAARARLRLPALAWARAPRRIARTFCPSAPERTAQAYHSVIMATSGSVSLPTSAAGVVSERGLAAYAGAAPVGRNTTMMLGRLLVLFLLGAVAMRKLARPSPSRPPTFPPSPSLHSHFSVQAFMMTAIEEVDEGGFT